MRYIGSILSVGLLRLFVYFDRFLGGSVRRSGLLLVLVASLSTHWPTLAWRCRHVTLALIRLRLSVCLSVLIAARHFDSFAECDLLTRRLDRLVFRNRDLFNLSGRCNSVKGYWVANLCL